MAGGSCALVINTNANELTHQSKVRHWKNRFLKNETTSCCDKDTHFRYKDTNRFNIKVSGKDTPLK